MKTNQPMRTIALKHQPGLAGEIKVTCCKTGKRAMWNDAACDGWVADANGKPFHAYYSPEGLALEANDRAAH